MQADFVLDYDVLTVEQPHKLYLMARLTSGPAQASQRRRPLNLSLVIDRSGSMAGDKIAYTRQAAQFLVQHLSSSDILSIVLYNDSVEVLLPPEPISRKDYINQLIGNIKTGSTTNLSGGWLEGAGLVARNQRDDYLNRVILMSDGLANRGITDPSRLVLLAQQKREQGISTTTMGLGEDFNEDLLMAMADAGGGAFYFIESPEVAPSIFEEELRGLLNLIGQNLVVTLDMGQSITDVKQLNAYPMQVNDRRVSIRMGDVYGEEVKTVVLELAIPALRDLGEIQIATLRFEYDEMVEGGSQHHTLEMPVMVNIAPPGAAQSAANPSVRQSVLLLKAAQARREAVTAADKGQYKQASEVLRQVAAAIDDSQIHSDVLAEERAALERQADEIERGAYGKYDRKSISTQAFYSMKDWHEGTQMLRTRELERLMKKSPVARQEGVTPRFLNWKGKMFPLSLDLLRIGRAPQNEIIIDARSISRFHAQIKRENGKLVLEDLGSTNGTFLNNVRLEAAHPLSVGDVARFGNEEVVFQEPVQPPEEDDLLQP